MDNCTSSIKNQTIRIISGAIVLSVNKQANKRFAGTVLHSTSEFNFTGLKLYFDVRAAIPLNHESGISLFNPLNRAYLLIVKNEGLSIGSGLFYNTLKRQASFVNPDLTEFTIYRMEVDQVKRLITTSWSMNGTLDEHKRNQVNFFCNEDECRELLMSKFSLSIITSFETVKPISQEQINQDFSDSSCNSMIIDYIRVYDVTDSEILNYTEIIEKVKNEKRASEICQMAQGNQVGKILLENREENFATSTIFFICLAIFMVILVTSLIVSIILLRKQRKKTNQAHVEEIYADHFENENVYEEYNYTNEYEPVDYEQVKKDEQEYLEITEV